MNVYTYTPEQYHCREGWAIEPQRGEYHDTYWGSGSDCHRLTKDETDSCVHQFDTADYDELDRYNRATPSQWATYNPADRAEIPSQHGLQRRYFVRTGSSPDRMTMVENVVERVREAQRALESARRDVEWAEAELARIAGGAS